MKTITIIEQPSKSVREWNFGYNFSNDEALNICADDLDDAMGNALSLNGLYNEEVEFDITTLEYKAVYNDDLVGYILTFKSGNEGRCQYTPMDNVLHANNREYYLEDYFQYYNDNITDEERTHLQEFCDAMSYRNQHLIDR